MKTLVLIDAANASAACRQVGKFIDWSKFRAWCEQFGFITHMNYYTAVLSDENGEQKLRRLLDYLNYNGYNVVEKSAKRYTNEGGETKVKGNMDVEIATDIMLHAKNVDMIILMTGDNDFAYAVRAAQVLGTHVVLVSLKDGNFCGADIRRTADKFIDLADVLKTCEMVRTPETAVG